MKQHKNLFLSSSGFCSLPFVLLGSVMFPPAFAADSETSDDMFHFYAKLYPEWKVESFTQPSQAGTVVGTMGTLKNNTVVLSADAKDKPDTEDHEWSSSYFGFKGVLFNETVRVGYDLQGTVDLQGENSLWVNARDNLKAREAFIYMEVPALGQLAAGQMDSIYKEWGIPVAMLGLTSGNFTGTSKMHARAGWKGKGDTSFHNRRSHSIRWLSPSFDGLQFGLTHSWDEQNDGDGGAGTKLSAAGILWQKGPWYVSLHTEIHYDWLPMSWGVTSSSATSIYNIADSTKSRDQGWRLSLAWEGKQWRIGSDFSRLKYSEQDALGMPGKFRDYRNFAWEVTTEYKWNSSLRLSASYARATAGQCTLSGDIPCFTTGLGGDQTNVGALYSVDKNLGVFALGSHVQNGDAAYYGSSPQGANANIYALGILYRVK